MEKQMPKWSPKEITELITLYSANVDAVNISKKLERSLPAVEFKLRTLRGMGLIDIGKGKGRRGIKNYPKTWDAPSFSDILSIEQDTINVSDVHIPYWHKGLFEKLVAIGRKFKIKACVLNGDFLNMDSFSRWVTAFQGEENTERELNTATYVLEMLLKTFDKIYWTQGNHEDRLLKALKGNISATRFLKMVESSKTHNKVITSDYPYCKVKTFDGWCIVGHPKNYSDRGGQTPADLADKYDSHVICGHNHQWGIQISRNGKWMGVDHGMGCDAEKVEYHQKNLVKNRTWQNGFSMIKDGHIYAFNLRFSDWNYWLK